MKTKSGIVLTKEEIERAAYFNRLHRQLIRQHAEKMATKTGKPLSPKYVERLDEYAEATEALLNTPPNEESKA